MIAAEKALDLDARADDKGHVKYPIKMMVAFCRQRPKDRPLNCCQMNPKTLAGSYSIVLKLRPLQRNKGNCCAKWVDDYGPKILNYDVNS